MSILIGTSISYSYPLSSENVFENLDFSISSHSKVGLIGKNGSGKTTLLKVINKIIKEYSGDLSSHSNFLSGYLPQNIVYDKTGDTEHFLWSDFTSLKVLLSEIRLLENDDSEVALVQLGFAYSEFQEHGGFEVEHRLKRLLKEFGFFDEDLRRKFSTFSGGEKTKLALLRVLLREPDLLLLDEPTNHLDLETLQWVEDYLKNSKLPFIVISHDRRFLDNCVNTIWELKKQQIGQFTGNYTAYEKSVGQQLASQLEDYKQNNRAVKKLVIAAAKQREVADVMESFKPKRSVAKNGRICKRDDGSIRCGRPKNKQKAATVMEKRLHHKQEELQESKPFIDKQYDISFLESQVKSRFVLRAEGLGKSYGTKVLFENLNIGLLRGSKISVVGKNGSGKTTLLKILNNEIQSDIGLFTWSSAVKVGYYSQEFECLHASSTIIDEVIQGDYENQTRARIILGSLGIVKDKVHQVIETLSEGEKSKTLLARLLFEQPDVLLLDEPTNHLEISSRKSLEMALSKFNGTLLLVSHDRFFVEKVTDEVINL